MSYTYSSVACAEVPDTDWLNGDIFQGLTAGVRLQCNWGDRFALINDLLSTPQPYPKTAGLGGMVPYAVSARCVTLGNESPIQNGQGIDYLFAYIDVNYNAGVVDLANEEIEPNMEAIPLDYRYFNFGGTASPKLLLEGEAPPLILQSFNFVRTRYRLSVIPTDFLNAVGCVNQYSYTSAILGFTFPAETLLFLPAPCSRSFTNFGTTGFTMVTKFGYKPNGWNKYWRTQTQAFESIYLNGSSTPYRSYTLYDMTNLLS
jgi:hypothetical protein